MQGLAYWRGSLKPRFLGSHIQPGVPGLRCYNVVNEDDVCPRFAHQPSELVREAADGGVIVIERRGEPVAELRPVTSPRCMVAAKKARIFASMQKVWDRMPRVNDSTNIIEDDRGR